MIWLAYEPRVVGQRNPALDWLKGAAPGNELITNEIVGPIKIARLMRLARIADVNVAVDNAENARALFGW